MAIRYSEDLLRKNMIVREPQLKEEQDYVASLYSTLMKLLKKQNRKSEKIFFDYEAPVASDIIFPKEAFLMSKLETSEYDYLDRSHDITYYLYINNGFFYYKKFTIIEGRNHWEAEITKSFMYDINSKKLYLLTKRRFYGEPPEHGNKYDIINQANPKQAGWLSSISELMELRDKAGIVSENQRKIQNIWKSVPDDPNTLYFYEKKMEFAVPFFLFFFLCVAMMAIIVPLQICLFIFLIAVVYKESISVKRQKIIRNIRRIEKDMSVILPDIPKKSWVEEVYETCEIVVKDFIQICSDIYWGI